ncbi:MAG: 7-cyano-7-deazaguanine synthase [Phycisphaerae bacterium]
MGALTRGTDFRLDTDGAELFLGASIPSAARDILHIGMAAFVVDRIQRRDGGRARDLEIEVAVENPRFWAKDATLHLVRSCLEFVTPDTWSFRFAQDSSNHSKEKFLPWPKDENPPTVCLYSGGLDSAAGLAARLNDRNGSVIPVAAWSQGAQRRAVIEQMKLLQARFGANRSTPLIVKSHLLGVPWNEQESSQRSRSVFFAALGCAVAVTAGASKIELYESGVGALNLPPMAGMLVGGRSTRHCHPEFLRRMGLLASHVVGRPITYELPFVDRTKAEVVRTLKSQRLKDLAELTFSCPHYPLFRASRAHQCGACLACIGRRQALLCAGVPDRVDYQHDLFSERANEVADSELGFLKAALMQVDDLAPLERGEMPRILERHLFGTQVVWEGLMAAPWAELMLRYRREWLSVIEQMRTRGVQWAKWLGHRTAASTEPTNG